MTKTVAIIGGGVAGLETAKQLNSLGYSVKLFEKSNTLGGHVAKWDRLFPNKRHASEVVSSLTLSQGNTQTLVGTTVSSIKRQHGNFIISANSNNHEADAVVLATGFELFPAEKKEEYGYGLFENVITSADLEQMFIKHGKPAMASGHKPVRIAFIHCVGSRDEKVNRPYCSKVCCVTAVKQAIEVKEAIPNCEVFCFYMDLRMFGPGYEDLYKEAQSKGVTFIRGRLSESSEIEGGRVQIKAEDTLASTPLKMSVDIVVLMVGMSPQLDTSKLAADLGLSLNADGFIAATDLHTNPTETTTKGVFVTGACTGPNNITDTVNAAKATALDVHNYLSR
ncbi:MAG: CoB--CoM heterodisulfide reductase iron-sulfur subunit A family protein [Bacteroidales bacterium]|nr:CoB--CoM heterodisulfide reductase iron-sulfur subunit A family protein [Bacteroidales bacterium]MBN2748699.1 CoB--CoM heterodisulfide reductase iron-sulfur subunit A family protein [Bacteroidales bacterium]